MFWRRKSPAQRLEAARRKGDIRYLQEICRFLDRANSLLNAGNKDGACALYAAVAELDIDDRAIGEAVDLARQSLEALGQTTAPSHLATYEQYLQSLPPHQRFVFLARQAFQRLTSAKTVDDKRQFQEETIAHFAQAEQSGPLSSRDRRVYDSLKSRPSS